MSYYEQEPPFEEEDDELDATADKPVETPHGSITITINMDQYLSGGTLEEKIAHKIALQVSSRLEKTIEMHASKLVIEKIENEFTEIAAKKLADCFDLPFQKYSEWGTKTGDPVVLRQLIIQRMDEWLKESVSNGNRGGVSRIKSMIDTIAIAPLNEAIKAKVKEVEAEVRGMVQQSVSSYIAQELTPKMPAVPQLK